MVEYTHRIGIGKDCMDAHEITFEQITNNYSQVMIFLLWTHTTMNVAYQPHHTLMDDFVLEEVPFHWLQ